MLVGEKGHAITGEESCHGGGERGGTGQEIWEERSCRLGTLVMLVGEKDQGMWRERSCDERHC